MFTRRARPPAGLRPHTTRPSTAHKSISTEQTTDPEGTDGAFLALSSLAFFAFIIEFLMSCFAKPGYLGTIDIQIPGVNSKKFNFSVASFYFWLDIIATVRTIHCSDRHAALLGDAARRTAER